MLEPKAIRRLSDEAMRNRLRAMNNMRNEYIAKIMEMDDINDYEIILQGGNRKTKDGKVYHTRTLSLIPIIDCPNCSGCYNDCYDIRNVCWQPVVQNDRARNSALHKVNAEVFWNKVETLCKQELAKIPVEENLLLRINVGGDLTEKDFKFVNDMVERNERLYSQFFTKNYKGINNHIDKYGDFNERVTRLISPWKGMECDNKHNLPESHVMFPNGETTADLTKPHVFCNGNCNECAETNAGCFGAKLGEQVILSSH